ncbi:MAG: CRISPR-associated endonuclease Cas3'' [Thermodesulfobacteriota bacterium]|nr:CRISPR-associated endonuclease Cas3'' [Thermodesulfobacteriota bacterium]
MKNEYYAHSREGRPPEDWHKLEDHLKKVAEMARTFADDFNAGDWAYLAGLWHDLGKYSEEFQERIRKSADPDAHIETKPRRPDHSTAGALFAIREHGKKGWPLAFAIAGHHAGLGDKTELDARFEKKSGLIKSALSANISADILKPEAPIPPAFFQEWKLSDKSQIPRSQEFWIRMLYSTLVDADFLDTEKFYDQPSGEEKKLQRFIGKDLTIIKERFDLFIKDLIAGAEDTPVNKVRAEVLRACREKALSAQGVFSLSAPTGSGKTLATMAFALNHAVKHEIKRIIIVIPFASIIEQNSKVYQLALNEENVIEHHANLDPEEETYRNRLACENWDAPVIVTTSVQFFESLLANRSSRCRKLHNITRSVVVFDEVQSLPTGHLLPILDLLKELVRNYRVSIVLSTATQPALAQRSIAMGGKFPGFEHITEIVADQIKTFEILKRTEIIWPEKIDEVCSWETLAADIRRHERVLAIVHRREDARILTRLLPEGTFHLSALMCAAHRSQVIDEIRHALKAQKIVRVVSTQLVEAGVDLDFPIVYRALGGLDSLAQAAGRCNREGKLTGKGFVHIFVPPTRPPNGTPAKAYDVTVSMYKANPSLDPLSPDIFQTFFRQLYFTQELDSKGIQSERAAFKFKTVSEKFNMIEDDGSVPVVVPFGESAKRVENLRRLGISRDRLRAIQSFIVNLYPQQIKILKQAGALETIGDAVQVMLPTHAYLYGRIFGLAIEGSLAADPHTLIQ